MRCRWCELGLEQHVLARPLALHVAGRPLGHQSSRKAGSVLVRPRGGLRRTRPVSMTRREELEHRAATHCRECLASFKTAEKKLHHCHGAGQYLGALCHSCNIAAQTPKTIPVVFHNGGGYDFHFLLRYIATMGSPVSRAPREELGEDSDNEGTESEAEGDQEGSGSEPERPMPMAKAAPKAAPKGRAKAAPRPCA